jgi:hypothetical protein
MTERTRFTAYITKYALTKGIEVVEVEDCFHVSPIMVVSIGQVYCDIYRGVDWHRTREQAIARAEVMRLAKIKALQASLDKFEAMRFV